MLPICRFLCDQKIVYDQKKISITDYKKALLTNYGKGMDATSISEMTAQIAESLKEAGRSIGEKEVAAILSVVKGVSESREVRESGEKLLNMIEEIPKFGNDVPEVDAFAREVAYTYTKPLETFKNPRGGNLSGRTLSGICECSAGERRQVQHLMEDWHIHRWQTEYLHPRERMCMDNYTAANLWQDWITTLRRTERCSIRNSIPSALSGRAGLENFVALIRSYFDQKGSHMQFNVVSRETLLDAQKHPEQYKHLVVSGGI